jgi:hypothetical protein
MLTSANSLPPARNLHAFHVSSLMVLSTVFFSLQESSRGSCGTWSTSPGSLGTSRWMWQVSRRTWGLSAGRL